MFNVLLTITPSLQRVLITSIVLGFLAGSFGVFIVLKKQALVGDSLAHAALPGVVITYILFQTKSLEILLLGAAISGVIAIFLFNIIKKHSKIKNDATLALILAGFFGLGRLLLSVVQRSSGAGSAGLNNFIFGQTATILLKDMFLILAITIVINIIVVLFWKELKLQTFNNDYFNSLGFNSKVINVLFSILIVLVVVAGIQMIGIVLISALLIAPAVAARQWSHRLSINFITAGLIGAISGLVGVFIGDSLSLPPGPTIIVVLSTIVLISLLFAPKNGVIIKQIKQYNYRKLVKKYGILLNLYQDETCPDKDECKLEPLVESGHVLFKNNQYILSDIGLAKVNMILGGKRDGK